METQNIYTIYDTVADKYGDVFIADNDKVAERNATNGLRQTLTPEDYDLYKIGKYNPKTSQIGAIQKQCILTGAELKENIKKLFNPKLPPTLTN